MNYSEFSNLVGKKIKQGAKKIWICEEYGIYPQKLNYYLKVAEKSPNKMVPVELNEKLKYLSSGKKKT